MPLVKINSKLKILHELKIVIQDHKLNNTYIFKICSANTKNLSSCHRYSASIYIICPLLQTSPFVKHINLALVTLIAIVRVFFDNMVAKQSV